MFGLGRKSKSIVALNQTMGRLINQSYTSQGLLDQAAQKERSESRSRRNMACVLFFASEIEEPTSYAIGVTIDLSLQGLSLITTENIEPTEFIVAIGNDDERAYLRGTCKYCRRQEFGTYFVGLELHTVLNPQDCYRIVQAVKRLEEQ